MRSTWSLLSRRLSGMGLSGSTSWHRSSSLSWSYPGQWWSKWGPQSLSSGSLGKHTVPFPTCFSRFKWNFGLLAVFIFNPGTQSDLEAIPKYYGPQLTQFFFTEYYHHIFSNAVFFFIWHSFQWYLLIYIFLIFLLWHNLFLHSSKHLIWYFSDLLISFMIFLGTMSLGIISLYRQSDFSFGFSSVGYEVYLFIFEDNIHFWRWFWSVYSIWSWIFPFPKLYLVR